MTAIHNNEYRSGGKISYAEHDGWKRGTIKERVSITEDSDNAALTTKLPATCRILWVKTKNATAVSVAGAGTNATADGFALTNSLPATGTVSTSTNVMAFQTTLTDNASKNANSVITANTTTNEVTLYLLPTDSGGANYFFRNTTTTSGLHFDAAATVDVEVHFEYFPDIPTDSNT